MKLICGVWVSKRLHHLDVNIINYFLYYDPPDVVGVSFPPRPTRFLRVPILAFAFCVQQ